MVALAVLEVISPTRFVEQALQLRHEPRPTLSITWLAGQHGNHSAELVQDRDTCSMQYDVSRPMKPMLQV